MLVSNNKKNTWMIPKPFGIMLYGVLDDLPLLKELWIPLYQNIWLQRLEKVFRLFRILVYENCYSLWVGWTSCRVHQSWPCDRLSMCPVSPVEPTNILGLGEKPDCRVIKFNILRASLSLSLSLSLSISLSLSLPLSLSLSCMSFVPLTWVFYSFYRFSWKWPGSLPGQMKLHLFFRFHIAVDAPQRHCSSAAWEEQDIRERCGFYKPHHLEFYRRPWLWDECKRGSTVYGYPTAPAESSPLPQSVSRALLYTAIQQPPLSPPPSLRV